MVLNKYLSGIDEKKINAAWEAFTGHFHNAEIDVMVYELYGLSEEEVRVVEANN